MSQWDEIDKLSDEFDCEMFFVDGKFKPPLLAGKIAFKLFDIETVAERNQINRGFLVMKDNKQIYRYNGSYYVGDGEGVIKDSTQRILGIRCCDKYKNEVIGWLKDNTDLQIDRSIFDSSPHLINLQNGTYNLETDTFEEHNPGYLFNYQLPIRYDPKAKINKIKTFFEEILYEKDIPIMQEFFGDCLQPTYKYKKALMNVGLTNTGKSQVMGLLEKFLGAENTANVSLYDLCHDKYSPYELYSKKANICADIGATGLRYTERFKQLTGNKDRIRAQKKFKDAFGFINFAKLTFSCNEIPESADTTNAYYGRWIVIEYPNQFNPGDKKTDPDILEKITTEEEMSGLFNWAIEGLKRLKKNKCYSEHRTLEEVKEFMQKHRKPLPEFATDFILPDPENEITKGDLYKMYGEFCDFKGYPKLINNVFSRQVKNYLPRGWNEGQSRKITGRPKVWRGIKCTWEFGVPVAEDEKQLTLTTEEQQEERD